MPQCQVYEKLNSKHSERNYVNQSKSDENENLIFLDNEKLTDQSIFQIGTMIADRCTAESENSRNNSRYLATQGNEKEDSHGLNKIFIALYNYSIKMSTKVEFIV